MLMLYIIWPPNEEHINVVVSYKAEARAPGMEVFLGAGADYSYLPTLQPGDRLRTLLIPGREVVLADERRLFMRYYPVGHSKGGRPEWHGPDLPLDASYRVAIDIHADGHVTYRYCIKPCKLPNQAKGLSP